MDYHEDTSYLAKTPLNVFCNNPHDYYCQYITRTMARKEPTGDMATGSVLHAAMLEQKAIDDLIGVYPKECLKTDGTLNGKPAAKYRAENPGKVWMKEAERDRIKITYDRLMDTAISEAIAASTKFEHEWRANLYGRNCKCKSDIAGDLGGQWAVYDLKFTPTISQFAKSSKQFRYWLQDCHYSAVISANVGKPVVFKFLVAETVAPYRARVYYYDEIKREQAAKYHKSKILSFMACETSGVWPDLYEANLPLSEWDLGGAGDVLFDDEVLDDLNTPVDELEEVEMPF